MLQTHSQLGGIQQVREGFQSGSVHLKCEMFYELGTIQKDFNIIVTRGAKSVTYWWVAIT